MFIETTATTRRDKKAATRARILSVARDRLEDVGFDATSIRDVAKDAGVAPGTVLLHFTDKSDLLHAALFEGLDRVWARAKKAPRGKSLELELTAVARAFYAFYAARPALSRALLRESLFAAPPWSQRFAVQVGDVHAHVVARGRAARERGELSDAFDLDVLGAAFLSFYYFALLAWVQGSHEDPTRLFRRLLAQHLLGSSGGASKAPLSASSREVP